MLFNQFGDQGNQWNEETVTLANYSGVVHFKISAYRGSSFTGDIAIDNFEVREAPTCPKPYNLNAINVFADSVDLTWLAGLNETEWQVFLVPSGGTLANTSPTLVNNDTVTVGGGSIDGDTIQGPGQAEVELNIQNGLIVGVNVVNGGFGFTDLPDLLINSDTGAGARLKPVLKFTKVDDAAQLAQTTQDSVVTVISCIEK